MKHWIKSLMLEFDYTKKKKKKNKSQETLFLAANSVTPRVKSKSFRV